MNNSLDTQFTSNYDVKNNPKKYYPIKLCKFIVPRTMFLPMRIVWTSYSRHI